MTDEKFVTRENATLPKKSWLRPLPHEARFVDAATGEPKGRWHRVYADKDGRPIVLKTKPVRNEKVFLPEGLIPASA